MLTATCYGQKEIVIPSEFTEISPPEKYSDEWGLLNRSDHAFEVRVSDGTLDIRKIQEKDIHELIISNGTLYGTAAGEWGGLLTFIPFADTMKH